MEKGERERKREEKVNQGKLHRKRKIRNKCWEKKESRKSRGTKEGKLGKEVK